MSTETDYTAYYQAFDQMFRSGMGIEIARGWHLYAKASGKRVAGPFTTEAEANEGRTAIVAQMAAIAARNEEREAEKAAEQAKAAAEQDRSYREVNSVVYGRGRRYASHPGATQYDNGDGSYSVQIWDES